MRIYYFVHLTGRDKGQTGIQRVVRNLGRALQLLPDIDLVPVRWSHSESAVVHAEQIFCEMLAMHRGPSLKENKDAGKPIHVASNVSGLEDSWLLIPEVPHLKSHDVRFPSVHMTAVLGYARTHSLLTAVVFHDLLPLTAPRATGSDESEVAAFIAYAQSLANADVVFPVSRTSEDALLSWSRYNGFRPEHLPHAKPILLAEEVPGIARKKPYRYNAIPNCIKFISLGTVSRRKNQLKAFEAFNRLRLHHPNINFEFNVVGTVDPELAGSVARQVVRSNGSIKLYGFLPDEKMIQLVDESRASVFVSVAEGFGLPIAESLWLGKPCLCSNFGAMAEVAAEGGCVTVDPTNVAEIEAGLDQLATDGNQYEELLQQLESRQLRTWQEYASDIRGHLKGDTSQISTEVTEFPSHFADYQPMKQLVRELLVQLEFSDPARWRTFASDIHNHLDINDGGASLSRWIKDRQAKAPAEAGQKSFQIDLKSLRYHDEYLKGGKAPIFDQNVIRYRRVDFDGPLWKIKEPHLFYGPYLSLEAGRYMFSIDGDLTGSLTINFVKDFGTRIHRVTLTKLDETIVFDSPKPIKNFEIVGEKTDQTEALEIRSIFVEFIPLGSFS